MVEVFKTNIDDSAIAQQIISEIKAFPLNLDASFDLDDCDRILRVCGSFEPLELKDQIVALLNSKDYLAIPLDDDTSFTTYLSEEHLVGVQNGIIAFLSIR